MKGLPLAYDRDLQEDKQAVFDAHDALAPALEAMAGMVRTLEFDPARMRERWRLRAISRIPKTMSASANGMM